MPDSNPDLSNLTPKDVQDIRQYEEELDREIARVKAIGVAPTSFEAQLISVPVSTVQTNAALGQSSADGQTSVPAPDLLAPASSPWLESLLAQTAQDANTPPQLPVPSIQPAAAPTQTNGNFPTDGAGESASSDGIEASGGLVSARNPLTTNPLSAVGVPAGTNTLTPQADTSAAFYATNESARAAAEQTQLLQQSADRVRAVLEQNTGLTNSIFSQMLELLGGQNQKLGEMDRRILDLSGQLKSLKNP